MVEFFRAIPGQHEDHRRRIFDAVLPSDLKLPFPVKQQKIVDVKKAGLVVGNHYHTVESGRHECFVVLARFTLRFRDAIGGEIKERVMEPGDGCLIPPMCSHAFRSEEPGIILGLANMAQNDKHDVRDVLFE